MKHLISITILLNISLFVFSQNTNKAQKLERIKAHKVAMITEALSLTSAEAQQFWPVYNDFFKKKEELNKRKNTLTRSLTVGWETKTENEKIQLADGIIAFRLELAQLEQEYHEKFKQILPIQKVIKLYIAETKFKSYLLKQINGQNENNRPLRDPNPPRRK